MKNSIYFLGLYSGLLLLLTACGTDNKHKPTDTLGKGRAHISVDETFQPAIENEIKVFQSINPEAQVIASYEPETQCYKDIFGDSVQLIIVTRPPSPQETQAAEAKKMVLDAVPIAKDAIAVVIHPDNPDTNLSVQQLKGILTGTYSKKYTVVFDNEGSSMVRYIQDSILKGAPMGSNVFAAKTNPAVVDYVAQNKNAIGFVGLSYVSDTGDSTNESFLSKIKIAALYNDSLQDFYRPYQAFLALNYYPLTRTVYYVSRQHYPGLATGFANFISQDRGQLIFSKFRLFPLKMNIVIRDAQLNTN